MLAKALAAGGASKVYIAGRRIDVLNDAAAKINTPGVTVVVPLVCDVTSKESLEGLAAAIEKDAGYLNLVVCNAGISGPQIEAPGPETTIEEYRRWHLGPGVDAFTETHKVSAVYDAGIAALRITYLALESRV
jgi:NAD(P)-dependent dehydrogenase (short-subunit alcohol dehydrogenase family)